MNGLMEIERKIRMKSLCRPVKIWLLVSVVTLFSGAAFAKPSKGVWWWHGPDAVNTARAAKRLRFLSAHGVDEIYFCADLAKYGKETRAFVKAAGRKGMASRWGSDDNKGDNKTDNKRKLRNISKHKWTNPNAFNAITAIIAFLVMQIVFLCASPIFSPLLSKLSGEGAKMALSTIISQFLIIAVAWIFCKIKHVKLFGGGISLKAQECCD